MRTRNVVLAVTLGALLACSRSAEGPATGVGSNEASTDAPASVADLIDRMPSSSARSFDLAESEAGRVVRTGSVDAYGMEPHPVIDLTWQAGSETTRVRSDGETMYVKKPDGELLFSPWSEAGSVLYGDAAGKLLAAALDPSSFAAYGAALEAADSEAALRAAVDLPGGGSWDLEVSTETWQPLAVEFRADGDAPVQRLVLEPAAASAAGRPSELDLQPDEGRPATRYYAGPAPGDPAPEVAFELTDGASVELGELRGSVVVIDFWATWCLPCRPAMRSLEELYRRHRDDGLVVYGLRLFDSGDASDFLTELGVSYPVGDGGPFVEPYAVGSYGLPTLYVIDREGVVVKLLVGFSEGAEAALIDVVERALRSE